MPRKVLPLRQDAFQFSMHHVKEGPEHVSIHLDDAIAYGESPAAHVRISRDFLSRSR